MFQNRVFSTHRVNYLLLYIMSIIMSIYYLYLTLYLYLCICIFVYFYFALDPFTTIIHWSKPPHWLLGCLPPSIGYDRFMCCKLSSSQEPHMFVAYAYSPSLSHPTIPLFHCIVTVLSLITVLLLHTVHFSLLKITYSSCCLHNPHIIECKTCPPFEALWHFFLSFNLFIASQKMINVQAHTHEQNMT